MTRTPDRSEDPRYQTLKSLLEAKREEIRRQFFKRVREGMTDDERIRPDQYDEATRNCEADIDIALMGMKAENLEQIDEAIRRLDENRYGKCQGCGNEIPEVRLRALPSAVRCRRCEEAKESRERSRRAAEANWRQKLEEPAA
jgi:DnaK suppressor protein